MIPQRNISLVANGLMRTGGRRILESVIERDYVLAWLLNGGVNEGVKPTLPEWFRAWPDPASDLSDVILCPVYSGTKKSHYLRFYCILVYVSGR
ncbi:hypothetical protein Plut_1881 [Pelodictyon luteolum DSM 273]|uniref:Uncharacterized protein n=1 Tax=Chlorobium luteolum (strain DSM 273 / BCRC 81028 / 2530) TaxID=319225 RepID=Q3B1Q2_CHLL3|nr:hypothetical protein Plut_1881 [Pelodictyon luteolum DSM 273]